MRCAIADTEHVACGERRRAETGEGVARAAVERGFRRHTAADGDDVAQPARGVPESELVTVDGGEGHSMGDLTRHATVIDQLEGSDGTRDGGDPGTPEAQHRAPDALEHGGTGLVADGTVRVSHRTTIGDA